MQYFTQKIDVMVTVKVAGKSKTVKLSRTGKATVKIVPPKSAKTGKKTATVSYGGDARVASSKLIVTR